MKNEIHDLKQEQLKMIRDDEKEYFQLKDVLIREKKYKLQLQNEIEARGEMDILLREKTAEIGRLVGVMEREREKGECERKRRVELEEAVNGLEKRVAEKEKTLRDTAVHNDSLMLIERGDKKAIKELT